MYNLERYEFSATDSLYEKLDAKLGNFLVRSEERAEARHATYMQKMREKYAKAKAKADKAEAYYSQERVAKVSDWSDHDSKGRVVNF